jgi:hypothetical protein
MYVISERNYKSEGDIEANQTLGEMGGHEEDHEEEEERSTAISKNGDLHKTRRDHGIACGLTCTVTRVR